MDDDDLTLAWQSAPKRAAAAGARPAGARPGGGGGGWMFRTPDRTPIPASPALPDNPEPLDGDPLDPDLIRPGWRGEPFSLADSVNAFCHAADQT